MENLVSVLELPENDSIVENLCGEYILSEQSARRLTLSENGTFYHKLGSALRVKGTWELKGCNLFLQMQNRTLEAMVVYNKIIGGPNSFVLEGIWEKVDQN